MMIKQDSATVVMIHDLQTADAAIVHVELLTGSIAQNELYVATGDARRDPLDRDNKALGYKLALGRALRTLSAEILREANGLIRDQETERQRAIAEKVAVKAQRAERSAEARAEGLRRQAELAKAKKKKPAKKAPKKAPTKKKPARRK